MIEALARLVKNMDNRISNLIKLGKTSNFIEDNRPYPTVQVSYLGSIHGNATVVYPYGMSGALPEDTLGIVLTYLGHESNRLFIPLSTDTRVKSLKRKEIAVGYGDQSQHQSYIKFDEEGNIIIKTDKIVKVEANKVEIDAAKIELGTGSGLEKIARVGDTVKTNIGGTDYNGTIITGGTNESI